MTDEKTLFDELGRIPPLPDLYPAIQRRIARQALGSRALLALAAALIIAATGTFWTRPETSASPDVAEAVRSIHDYCTGDDLNEEMENYAVLDF